MLVLDATTKSIVVAMSGSAATTNPDFTAAYLDNTGTTITEGANDGVLNGTNSVTLAAAPAASTRRQIKTITIENRDTAAVTIIVSYNNNSTLRTIVNVTLQVGDTWTTDGTFDSGGRLKSTGGGTMSLQNADSVQITGGTISNTTISTANISASTSANATFATASLPLVPEGYITIKINGTDKKIPYYGV